MNKRLGQFAAVAQALPYHCQLSLYFLDLRLRRWQVPRIAFGYESVSAVSAIAERLVLGHAATAERDDRATG